MNIPVFVRPPNESVEVLYPEVVTCLGREALPPTGESKSCGIPGCMRVIEAGLFGSFTETGGCKARGDCEALPNSTIIPTTAVEI